MKSLLRSTLKFHTDPLSSTYRFHTRTKPFQNPSVQHQNPLSSTQKTPKNDGCELKGFWRGTDVLNQGGFGVELMC